MRSPHHPRTTTPSRCRLAEMKHIPWSSSNILHGIFFDTTTHNTGPPVHERCHDCSHVGPAKVSMLFPSFSHALRAPIVFLFVLGAIDNLFLSFGKIHSRMCSLIVSTLLGHFRAVCSMKWWSPGHSFFIGFVYLAIVAGFVV